MSGLAEHLPRRSARAWVRLSALLLIACGSNSDGDDGSAGNGATDGPGGGAGELSPGEELIEDVDTPSQLPSECARDTYNAERVDVNLYLVLDVSGSMSSPIAVDTDVTQWDAVRAAVTEFIESPESAGFNLALNYYPLMSQRTNCSATGACDGNVQCVSTLCDLRFAFAGIYTPCTQDNECELSIEIDGEVYGELCVQPGRCSNDSFELCFLDEQCPSGGSCVMDEGPGLCPGEVSCEAEDYSTPSVQRGPLPDQAPRMVESLLSQQPDIFSNTPTHVALAGAYLEVDGWIQDEPNTRSFVVLATDGAPIGCASGSDRAAVEAEATQRTYDTLQVGSDFGIDTFVIGVYPDLEGLEPGEADEFVQEIETLRGKLTEMARIGGTGSPYDVTANANATDAFLDALAEIRGEVLPCEYLIPEPDSGTVAFDQLNVELTSGGESQTVLKVGGEGECAPGENSWYYNVDENAQTPTSVLLCPDTCANANQVSGSQIDIVLGCQTVVRDVR